MYSPVWSLPTKGVGAYQRSLISDTLQGLTTTTITCKCCGYVDKRMDPFLVLRFYNYNYNYNSSYFQ